MIPSVFAHSQPNNHDSTDGPGKATKGRKFHLVREPKVLKKSELSRYQRAASKNNEQKPKNHQFTRKFVTSGAARSYYQAKNSKGPAASSKDANITSSYATNNLIQMIKSKKSNKFLKKASV